MGFLDQSTNNIILDAVLTDKGREFLSRNDGSFSIIKFALGDDEVDYNIIQQYGRTVGKEKIEKNTPILEASTLGNVAIKHKLISSSNGSLVKLPTLSISSDVATYTAETKILSLTRSASTGVTSSAGMIMDQVVSGEEVPTEMIDNVFSIEVNHQFLRVSGLAPDVVDVNNIETGTLQFLNYSGLKKVPITLAAD